MNTVEIKTTKIVVLHSTVIVSVAPSLSHGVVCVASAAQLPALVRPGEVEDWNSEERVAKDGHLD